MATREPLRKPRTTTFTPILTAYSLALSCLLLFSFLHKSLWVSKSPCINKQNEVMKFTFSKIVISNIKGSHWHKISNKPTLSKILYLTSQASWTLLQKSGAAVTQAQNFIGKFCYAPKVYIYIDIYISLLCVSSLFWGIYSFKLCKMCLQKMADASG